MEQTLQQIMAEIEAAIIEFDRVTKGLFKPREDCVRDETRGAKIYRLNDYRALH